MWLKITHIHYISISVGQNSRDGGAGCFTLESPVEMLTWAGSDMKAQLGMACIPLTACWQVSVPCSLLDGGLKSPAGSLPVHP